MVKLEIRCPSCEINRGTYSMFYYETEKAEENETHRYKCPFCDQLIIFDIGIKPYAKNVIFGVPDETKP